MTYRGKVKDGVVVLDEPGAIEEGSEVSVRPLAKQSRPKRPRTVNERYRRFIGIMDGLPPDFSINHDHYLYGTKKRTT